MGTTFVSFLYLIMEQFTCQDEVSVRVRKQNRTTSTRSCMIFSFIPFICSVSYRESVFCKLAHLLSFLFCFNHLAPHLIFLVI